VLSPLDSAEDLVLVERLEQCRPSSDSGSTARRGRRHLDVDVPLEVPGPFARLSGCSSPHRIFVVDSPSGGGGAGPEESILFHLSS